MSIFNLQFIASSIQDSHRSHFLSISLEKPVLGGVHAQEKILVHITLHLKVNQEAEFFSMDGLNSDEEIRISIGRKK